MSSPFSDTARADLRRLSTAAMDDHALVTREPLVDPRPIDGDTGEPIGELADEVVYDGPCKVIDDEISVARAAGLEVDIRGRALIRLPYTFPVVDPDPIRVLLAYAGVERRGRIESWTFRPVATYGLVVWDEIGAEA